MRSLFYRTILSIGFLSIFFVPLPAHAASLGISPANDTYLVGKIFPVNVYISSPNESINAISAKVQFPADKLRVVSVSKLGSVLTLWVSDPTYSNSDGTVNFEGVVPNPGYQGVGGRVVTINFQVVAQGDATVGFGNASVLANDGNGTNVLQNKNSALFNFIKGTAAVNPLRPSPNEDINLTPKAPIVSSIEFPDQKVWYQINHGTFSWKSTPDTTEVRILVSKQPNSKPNQLYESAISSKEITEIQDGVWYFHVQLKNKVGWGGITHYLFRVDTTAPDTFVINEVSRPDLTEPQPSFSFKATDATSGINHYEVQIDSKEQTDWIDDGNGIYKAPILGPGVHKLVAKAIDEAGNFSTASIDFSITGIEVPVITSYNEQVSINNPLVVKGTAPKGDRVHLVLTSPSLENVEMYTSVDDSGHFIGAIDSNKFKSAVYKLTATTVDSRGAQSVPTSEKTVTVIASWFKTQSGRLLNLLSIFIPILALLFLLLFIILYGISRIQRLNRKFNRELREVEGTVNKALALLKVDMEGNINLLEQTKIKRLLSEEESKILTHLKQNLYDIEKVINKQVKVL